MNTLSSPQLFLATGLRGSLLLAVALAVAACSKPAPPPTQAAPAAQGRSETQNIRRVQVMGVDGAPIADRIDAGLDQAEAAAKAQREAIEAQTSGN